MTEADSGANPGARLGWRWDVALSFAGAQRDYVEQVAQTLKARGLRCFYDADEQIELWGKYLAEELPAIYGDQAAAVVVFISADYLARDWTRLERRAALARAVRDRREYVLPARFDDTPLPGLLADMVTVDLRGRSSEQFADMVVGKLAALGTTGPTPPGAARDPAPAARPAGTVRVAEADPRTLGVHAAISVPGVQDEVPPRYVPRDVDAAEFGIRARVAAAAERGGFVLLVGGSSAGKTRCAVEAVRALLPEWWLVHPAGPAEIAALATAPSSPMVVWLDELQRYLDGEQGLTGAVVRALLGASHPVVIIGTLWPYRYAVYTTVPTPGGADPNAREREVLDLAAVIRIAPEFTPAEQDRAHAAAVRDRRLKIALESPEYGLTQTLAAAPQLVARWEDARTANPYAWAVLTAALDAARLGARTPLSGDLMRAAAPGYCTSQQQAEAPENWFEQALAYATGKLHGAAAALTPTGVGMGQIAGYTAADYLIQRASRERRYERVPASTWDALLSHIRDPDDADRLAYSAEDRLLYRYAIPLYRLAAKAGDEHAAKKLADLLARRGDLDELCARADAGDEHATMKLAERGDLARLRARADAGDWDASTRLAWLLAERGDLDELRGRADAGDWYAARLLADLLAERGLDGLRARADAGDEHAAKKLADLLAERGDLARLAGDLARLLDEWRARADAGDEHAAKKLTERSDLARLLDGLRARTDAGDEHAAKKLTGRGDLDELRARAEHLDVLIGPLEGLLDELTGDLVRLLDEWRARADAGDEHAAKRLSGLVAGRGDLIRLLDGLRARAEAGDWDAARKLAERGDLDGLRTRANADDKHAAKRLADLLADRGDLDELRARANAADKAAAKRLADLLAGRGDLDELRARANAGDKAAAWKLAHLLAERGGLARLLSELRARADAGDEHAAAKLADVLAGRGGLAGLRARANAGDESAGRRLADLLADCGDLDGLRGRAEAGDWFAARSLAELLAEHGDLDGLRARADTGDEHAAERLAELLADHGDLAELSARANADDEHAAAKLAELLAERGDLDGLRARADAGDEHAAERLAELLADRGDLDELSARAGDQHAARKLADQLTDLLTRQGCGEEAERLRRFGLNPDGSIARA